MPLLWEKYKRPCDCENIPWTGEKPCGSCSDVTGDTTWYQMIPDIRYQAGFWYKGFWLQSSNLWMQGLSHREKCEKFLSSVWKHLWKRSTSDQSRWELSFSVLFNSATEKLHSWLFSERMPLRMNHILLEWTSPLKINSWMSYCPGADCAEFIEAVVYFGSGPPPQHPLSPLSSDPPTLKFTSS